MAGSREESLGLTLLVDAVFEPFLPLDSRLLSSAPLCLDDIHDAAMGAVSHSVKVPWKEGSGW